MPSEFIKELKESYSPKGRQSEPMSNIDLIVYSIFATLLILGGAGWIENGYILSGIISMALGVIWSTGSLMCFVHRNPEKFKEK